MKYDAIVIGAGVIGLSTAYHILRENPGSKILVLEKFAAPGQGNTAKSAGAYRNVFSSETNFLLADTSIDFYKDIQKGNDIGMENVGYLWLFSQRQYEKLVPVLDGMKKKGIELKFFDPDELESMVPDLDVKPEDEESRMMYLEPVHVGMLGKKCGLIDADKLTRFYEREIKKLGGEIKYNTEVKKLIVEPKEPLGVPWEPFIWQDADVVGLEISAGEFRAGKIIVASNAWSPFLLDPLGIDCFIKPVKHQLFVLRNERLSGLFNMEFNEKHALPFTILPKGGVYMRADSSENSVWVSAHDIFRGFRFEEDPVAENEFYEYNIYQILRKYFPVFDGINPSNRWAGLYDMNSLDANPIIFEKGGIMAVVGLSGSGIMKADAVGRIAAALYNGKEYAELYGGRKFRVSDLGIAERRVEKEEFIL